MANSTLPLTYLDGLGSGGTIAIEDDSVLVEPAVKDLNVIGASVTYNPSLEKHELNITALFPPPSGANTVFLTADGLATAWNQVGDSYISDVSFTKVTNRPTTLGGYGITDGISASRAVTAVFPVQVNGTSSATLASDIAVSLAPGAADTVLSSNGSSSSFTSDPVVSSITGTSRIYAGPVGGTASFGPNALTFATGNSTVTSTGKLGISVDGYAIASFSVPVETGSAGYLSFDAALNSVTITQDAAPDYGSDMLIAAQSGGTTGGNLRLVSGYSSSLENSTLITLEVGNNTYFRVNYDGAQIALDACGCYLHNLRDPALAQDAATKAYVDLMASGVKVHLPVKAVATTAVGGGYSGLPTVDGVTLADGDRLLTTAEASAVYNRPWVVHSGSWSAADLTNGSHAAGAFFFVTSGANYANSGWICITAAPNDVVNTNNLSWGQMSAAGQILPGACLTKTGSTLDVVPASTSVPGSMSAADKVKLNGLGISGSTNYLPKFTGSTGIGNSSVYDLGTAISIGQGNFGQAFTATGGYKHVTVGTSYFDGTNYVTPGVGTNAIAEMITDTSGVGFIVLPSVGAATRTDTPANFLGWERFRVTATGINVTGRADVTYLGDVNLSLHNTASTHSTWTLQANAPTTTTGRFLLWEGSTVVLAALNNGNTGFGGIIDPSANVDAHTLRVRDGSPAANKIMAATDTAGSALWKSASDLNLVTIAGDIGGTSSSPTVVSLSGLYGEILTNAGTIRKTSGYLALQADNGAVELVSNYGISLNIAGSTIATFSYADNADYSVGIYLNQQVTITGVGHAFRTNGINLFYCGQSSAVCRIDSEGFKGPGSIPLVTVTNTPSGAGKVLTSTGTTTAAWL